MPHVQHAFAGLAHDRKCLDEHIVERFAGRHTLLELVGLLPELPVG
jgi:hypothetical protein